MKIKVVDKENPYFDEKFKVFNMNYDMIVVKVDSDHKIKFSKEEVELIPEDEHEKLIKSCEDILKIKLNKGVSITLYTRLITCIEEAVNEKVRTVDVLRDTFGVIRKGIWEKNLLLVINNNFPIQVNVIGRNYSKVADIIIKRLDYGEFIDMAAGDIKHIEEEIEDRKRLRETYKKSMLNILEDSVYQAAEYKCLQANI